MADIAEKKPAAIETLHYQIFEQTWEGGKHESPDELLLRVDEAGFEPVSISHRSRQVGHTAIDTIELLCRRNR